MDERDLLAERFEEHRPRLRAVAYRMLGSPGQAENAVQEAWLRLSRSGAGGIENLGGWLTTVVARVCLDALRSRRSRREQPIDEPRMGVRVPDPIVGPEDRTDPEHEALLADSVGPALLAVLETLFPAERLAFVMQDVFGVPFGEIAPIVGRSPTAARQLASRARRRVRGGAAAPDADPARQREVVDAFLAASREVLDLHLEGDITTEQFRTKSAELEEARVAADNQLEAARSRLARLKDIEQSKDALISRYASLVPQVLPGLSSEEKNQIYKTMRLRVLAKRDGTLIADWGCNVLPLPPGSCRTRGR